MNFEDLKPDDYYYAEYEQFHNNMYCIVKGKLGSRPNLYIDKENNVIRDFLLDNHCSAKSEIRLATAFEIHWLESCITNNKKISYNEAMLTFVDPTINYQQDPELSNILIKLLTQ